MQYPPAFPPAHPPSAQNRAAPYDQRVIPPQVCLPLRREGCAVQLAVLTPMVTLLNSHATGGDIASCVRMTAFAVAVHKVSPLPSLRQTGWLNKHSNMGCPLFTQTLDRSLLTSAN
eukprot:2664962-Rhodomonas_salina.1